MVVCFFGLGFCATDGIIILCHNRVNNYIRRTVNHLAEIHKTLYAPNKKAAPKGGFRSGNPYSLFSVLRPDRTVVVPVMGEVGQHRC